MNPVSVPKVPKVSKISQCISAHLYVRTLHSQIISRRNTRIRSLSSQATEQRSNQSSKSPLQNLRVLDLSRVLAGPFCAQLLADYGADVIKIEQPKSGDETRTWKSNLEASKWNSETMSLYFSAVNRNKRSITLNLKHQSAKEVLFELAKTCDVFVENFVPGKTESLGISYEVISKLNPRIIYASLSGYGNAGPYASRAGYDAIAAAEGGLMHVTGHPTSSPMRPGLGMTDMATGLLTHGAILAALYGRNLIGRGQHISTSLFETQLSLLINVGLNFLNLGIEGKRYGAAHPSVVPYNTYVTADKRWLALGANSDRQFKILCTRLKRPEVAEEEKYSTNAARVAAREEVDGFVAQMIAEKTIAEWLEILDGSGLAHGPVNSIGEALTHPQAQARDMVQEIDCDAFADGKLKVIGPAAKLSATPAKVRTRAPLLGEHTEEVLTEIGYNKAKIASLREEGAI